MHATICTLQTKRNKSPKLAVVNRGKIVGNSKPKRGCCKIHWISEGFASPSSFREFNGESFLTH